MKSLKTTETDTEYIQIISESNPTSELRTDELIRHIDKKSSDQDAYADETVISTDNKDDLQPVIKSYSGTQRKLQPDSEYN